MFFLWTLKRIFLFKLAGLLDLKRQLIQKVVQGWFLLPVYPCFETAIRSGLYTCFMSLNVNQNNYTAELWIEITDCTVLCCLQQNFIKTIVKCIAFKVKLVKLVSQAKKKHGTDQECWRNDRNKIERERGTLAESISDMIAFLTWMGGRQMGDRNAWITQAICYSHYLQYTSFFQHIQLLTSLLCFLADGLLSALSLPAHTNKRSHRQKWMNYISAAFTDKTPLSTTAHREEIVAPF